MEITLQAVSIYIYFFGHIGWNVPNGTEELETSFYNGITGNESNYEKEEETCQKSIMSV